jgi:hypothetical protein
MTNKKIKNATPIEQEGIKFKSKQESKVYKLLVEAGLNPKYEAYTFIIMPGFYPSAPCYDVHYDRRLKARVFGLSKIKIQDITYTPDFIIEHNNITFVIEVKGRENDVFPIKKKLFRNWMEGYHSRTNNQIVYFEVFNMKQTREAIEIIKQMIVENDEKETNRASVASK